jgi:hypothetical protein
MTDRIPTAGHWLDVRRVPWLSTLRRYLLVILTGNIVWETLHLPLYTIWEEGTAAELAFAVLHCIGGDVLIALSSLVLALILVGDGTWPGRRYALVATITIVFGLGYTIFSEWLNIVVRESWAYSDLMPVIPIIDTGLSPVAQWIVIPLVGFWWARQPSRTHSVVASASHHTIQLRSKSHV